MTSLERFDFCFRAGDDHDLAVTWRPGGVVPDLTGATAEMRVSWNDYPRVSNIQIAAGHVDFTSADGEIDLDTATGLVTVHMSADKTDTIPAATPTYQLRILDGSGVKTTIAAGYCTALRNLLDE